MEIGAIIIAISSLIVAFLKYRSENKPYRKEKQRDREIAEVNRIVAEGDVDAIALRLANIHRKYTRLQNKNDIPSSNK